MEPDLSADLIAPTVLPRLESVASRLPDVMSAYALEIRLAHGASQVDFLSCVTTVHRERLVLEKTLELLEPTVQALARSRARSFLECWATPGSALYGQIPFVWLEFDRADDTLPAELIPSINFCLDPTFLTRRSGGSGAHHPNLRSYQPFVDVALDHLLGAQVPERLRRCMVACFDALPPDGSIYHLASMLGRNPPMLKMNVIIPRAQIPSYLSRIGWPGEGDRVERILDHYIDVATPLRLDLTISDTVSPMLGLECFAGDSDTARPERHRLLKRLVDSGHCCPRRRTAVLRWSGGSLVMFPSQSWLTRIHKSWHVKLICPAGRMVSAKVYLGFAPSLCSPFGGKLASSPALAESSR